MPAGRLAGTIASTARAEAKPPSRQPGGGTPGRAAGPADPEPVHPEAWDREPTNESPPELSWYTWHRSAREPASEDAVREAERQLEVSLPSGFRTFLMTVANGAQPEDNIFRTTAEDDPGV